MKADTTHLFDFLSQNKTIFEIPVFQRNYEWDEEQCEQLFNDLVLAAQNNRDHFIGTIVYVSETGSNLSHLNRIIDGQQRLTTLTLLLRAIANQDEEHRQEIEEEFLFNKYLATNNHLKFKPIEHDIAAFNAVMNNKLAECSEPSKIIENYHFFEQKLQNSSFKIAELYEAMNHFELVWIELNNDQVENPQEIFESLNSTGKSLSASDLVRNFLLMGLDTDEQQQLYQEYWLKIEAIFSTKTFTEFLRHYLIMKTHAMVKKDRVYAAYKNFFYDKQLNAESALRELTNFARLYKQLLEANTASTELNKILLHINIMDSRVLYPYLLKLLADEEINSDQIIELAAVLENYLFRIKVCSRPTNGLNKTVVALCEGDDHLLDRELRLLKNTFPSDSELKASLMTTNLYKLRNNMAKLTLVMLEESRTKEVINFEDAQVEHIMPQHLTTDWRVQVTNADRVNEQYGGSLGNLTLTKYNQEMSNRTFTEKKEFYRDSNINLTREVAQSYSNWDETAITTRAKQLIAELLQIFPKPKVYSEKQAEQVLAGEYNFTDEVNITGRKPTSLTIGDTSYSVTSWRAALITLLDYLWDEDSSNLTQIKQDPSLQKKLFSSLRSPSTLKNGLQIETNYSARDILAIMTKITEVRDIAEQVSYTIN
ncbi:DUF262 domain-containing protein [Lactobacillus sp. ESL0677]|uniref:DUF262 domain-containing protein n=1 Tax=Lactobacillus sp. ESL0677 TaxID=2983208 RepID=UPI0023F6C5F6|nr:DUF262 domain-containing protein [Lactobacillus sp. ESL0677]WEV37469.1 DUF262 domain-containing protein [Lactobacillus sp. ESL0677]